MWVNSLPKIQSPPRQPRNPHNNPTFQEHTPVLLTVTQPV